MIEKLQLSALVFFIWVIFSALGQNLLSCESTSPDASGYRCYENGSQDQCGTFAILHANSYYSSLLNLSFYLGINRFVLAAVNGFSADTEFLPKDQSLLIPIDCKCNGSFFEAELRKTTIKGESFYGIAESLEGLTTCKAIQERNPHVLPRGLGEKLQLLIPLRCACPSSSELGQQIKLLLSYPVSEGDSISKLAITFNITPETIVSTNNRSGASFRPQSLIPLSTLLIPLNGKPILGSLAKPSEPYWGFPATSIPEINPHKRQKKMWNIGVYIAVSGVAVGAGIAIVAVFLVIQRKRKKQEFMQNARFGAATAEFEHKNHQRKEKRQLKDFNSSNLIEESVFHGRLSGKNLAIKRTQTQIISKIEFGLFHDAIHHHPNIIRLMGTCITDGPDSFLVFEYAKNGSLKDWLHGGLAMKSQFIASCYCFLTWNQRLKICLDVAMALQYMHQIMNPSYVHRNIKSRNIFLDEEFNAKVGNFGMARCVEEDTESSQSSSSHPSSWSKGYLGPEYLNLGIIAPSIDIFAYGVVLLEVLSGQTPITRSNEKGEGSVWLSEKIKLILESDNAAEELREWMDNALGENYSFDAAVTLANLARACVEDDPSCRPSAGEIVEKLSRLVEELPEAEQFSICESSCKPLVKAAANNM
ncbi:hypothetical protein F0562_004824 [Nyssa sinensis]|uniref:Protein kinase domain-containing protein n=1 Tax=Nyssa sinensis TaxID=561372 RepID=A0A5J5AGD6_9ASTE|nr:hypothetical protein F0562_004824 [Nyssa sinensis]